MAATLPRSMWGARASRGLTRFNPSDVRGVAVHWNGPAVGQQAFEGEMRGSVAYLKGTQRYHMETNGYSDIAYNLAVDNQGHIFELRGIGYRSGANGDTQSNREYVAILGILGQGQKPTEAMLDGIARAVAMVRDRYPGARAVKGHVDVRPHPTQCPGPDLLAAVRSGRFERAATAPAPEPPEEDVMASLEEVRAVVRDELAAQREAIAIRAAEAVWRRFTITTPEGEEISVQEALERGLVHPKDDGPIIEAEPLPGGQK